MGKKTPPTHTHPYVKEKTQRKYSYSTLINFDSPKPDGKQSSLWNLPPPGFIQSMWALKWSLGTVGVGVGDTHRAQASGGHHLLVSEPLKTAALTGDGSETAQVTHQNKSTSHTI